jgi:hypothetical protein
MMPPRLSQRLRRAEAALEAGARRRGPAYANPDDYFRRLLEEGEPPRGLPPPPVAPPTPEEEEYFRRLLGE